MTQTIFDDETPFKIGLVRLKKVYADEDKKEEELIREEITEVINEDYSDWVKEANETYDNVNATANAQLEKTIDAIIQYHPEGVFNNVIRFPASSDNLMLLIVTEPDDKLFANAGADDFDTTNDISLGKILNIIENEYQRLYNNDEVDKSWYDGSNLFFAEQSTELSKLISDNLKEVAEIALKRIDSLLIKQQVLNSS